MQFRIDHRGLSETGISCPQMERPGEGSKSARAAFTEFVIISFSSGMVIVGRLIPGCLLSRWLARVAQAARSWIKFSPWPGIVKTSPRLAAGRIPGWAFMPGDPEGPAAIEPAGQMISLSSGESPSHGPDPASRGYTRHDEPIPAPHGW